MDKQIRTEKSTLRFFSIDKSKKNSSLFFEAGFQNQEYVLMWVVYLEVLCYVECIPIPTQRQDHKKNW